MASASVQSISLSFSSQADLNRCSRRRRFTTSSSSANRIGTTTVRASSSFSDSPIPDSLSSDWLQARKKPYGPSLKLSAEGAVRCQLDALKLNDQPRVDYGVEIMYRFAGFDPFERSTYFGRFFDLGQFERFRRIFHHSTYRVLLGHKESKILSSLLVDESRFKQRIWIEGSRPEEEEIFEFTMVQTENRWPMGRILADGKLDTRRRWGFRWYCLLRYVHLLLHLLLFDEIRGVFIGHGSLLFSRCLIYCKALYSVMKMPIFRQ